MCCGDRLIPQPIAVGGHLLFVLSESSLKESINCKKHGVSAVWLSCQHLFANQASEVFLTAPEDTEPGTIWCAVCEVARIRDRGWYDDADSVAQWQVMCYNCASELISQAKDATRYASVDTPDKKPGWLRQVALSTVVLFRNLLGRR